MGTIVTLFRVAFCRNLYSNLCPTLNHTRPEAIEGERSSVMVGFLFDSTVAARIGDDLQIAFDNGAHNRFQQDWMVISACLFLQDEVLCSVEEKDGVAVFAGIFLARIINT